MDCEHFDQIVLDLLYGELTEGETLLAARRHLERCDRCSGVLSSLRSARQATSLPKVDPPADLRHRLLDAARAAQHQVPWKSRVGRWVSWAGSYAMRPQLAMAALLMLMIGSSLMLLRARPGQAERVRITEQGTPEGDHEDSSPSPAPERVALRTAELAAPRAEASGASRGADTPAPQEARKATGDNEPSPQAAAAPAEPGAAAGQAANAEADTEAAAPDEFAAAMAMYNSGDYGNAFRALDSVANKGGPNAPSAALHSARAVRSSAGCATALPRFESVMSRFGSSGVGIEARWEAAACARVLGDIARARQYYLELARLDAQRARAESELARLAPSNQQNAQRAAPAKGSSNRAQNRAPAANTANRNPQNSANSF